MRRMFNDQGGLERIKAGLEAAKLRMPQHIREAHDHCSNHRDEVLQSELCGCFYCGKTFPPNDIVDWTDDGRTAFCPKCGIDSVIGSVAGVSLTKEFLDEVNRYWF